MLGVDFSREKLAGYDRELLEAATVTLVGCGAAGSNILQGIALSGVGEVRLIDPDVIEPSNLTRSPLFRRESVGGARQRFKARELAQGFVALSYAKNSRALFANAQVETLGLGALAGSTVVISAVDADPVRAYLADACRRLGVPLVELGFSAPRGQVSLFPNAKDEEACWRCTRPTVLYEGVSCSLYAAQVAQGGQVPATQTVASYFAAIAVEAAIQAVHGRFPLGGKLVQSDVQTGRSRIVELVADPLCPGVHRRCRDIRTVEVRADQPVAAVLDALRALGDEPRINLPFPFLVEAPCARCGSPVSVSRPSVMMREPPVCRSCPTVPRLGEAAEVVVTEIAPGSPLAAKSGRALGLLPGAIFESGSGKPYRLIGDAEDLFHVKTAKVAEGGGEKKLG